MQPRDPENPSAREAGLDDTPLIKAPFYWRVRIFWRYVRIPAVVAILVLAFIFVPQLEAKNQQSALADNFFAECQKTLKDTDQLPKVPEEALADAIKKLEVTQSAIHSWNPSVSSEVRKGKWIARIQFVRPSTYFIEQTIGPALAEAGYDTPSAGQ